MRTSSCQKWPPAPSAFASRCKKSPAKRAFCKRLYRTLFVSLVEETKPTAWGFALSQERKFFADLCDRFAVNAGKTCESSSKLVLNPEIVEPLTKRQIELLRLLEAGLSNQQIADRVNVSLTTVKGHLQKLFSKLNVRSRSAALARARAINLL